MVQKRYHDGELRGGERSATGADRSVTMRSVDHDGALIGALWDAYRKRDVALIGALRDAERYWTLIGALLVDDRSSAEL